jgi:hypothetical protein
LAIGRMAIGRLAIGWRPDSRTLKAVLAALRCLQNAGHIDVLAGVRDGAPPPRLPDVLQEHGVRADLHLLPVTGDRVFCVHTAFHRVAIPQRIGFGALACPSGARA